MQDSAKRAVRTLPRGNNLDGVRRNNLSAVLTLLHTEGAVTRAQLTRETGLNRSTIGALVAELVSLQLVVEAEPDAPNQPGRPSLVIRPAQRTVALTVNPELDSVTIGLVALGGQVIKRIRYDTLRVPEPREVVNIVAAVVAGMRDELQSNYTTIGVGVAVPGLVRAGDGMINLAPHLGWHHEPLAEMLREALDLPVHAANDAAVGALAESTFGEGRHVQNLVYLNGGASGIGGGVIVNGEVLSGESGYAGEIGHTLVNSAGVACHCGSSGCLETEVRRSDLLEALGLPAGRSDEVDGVLLDRFAAEGGPGEALQELVDRQLDYLAVTVRNVVNLFNPELIVFGGFLGSLYEVAPERLDRAVAQLAMRGSRETARITRSSRGPELLVIGAAQLAFAELLRDPAGSAAARPAHSA
ncbi:ROK family protein [Herbiconiux sp. P15]|uniref:ROK family protein n=1 Tax=Herbiconiux liukaitaii TaxID=3342799 RepID=UPI0035B7EDDD